MNKTTVIIKMRVSVLSFKGFPKMFLCGTYNSIGSTIKNKGWYRKAASQSRDSIAMYARVMPQPGHGMCKK